MTAGRDWQKAIEPMIPEFEELTGIDVEVEQLPEEQSRQRVQVELTASSADLDVFMTSLERTTVGNQVVGGRSSVDFGDGFPQEWVDAYTSSIPNARPQLPAVIPVSDVRDVIGVAIIEGIEGGDRAAAMHTAEEMATTPREAGRSRSVTTNHVHRRDA